MLTLGCIKLSCSSLNPPKPCLVITIIIRVMMMILSFIQSIYKAFPAISLDPYNNLEVRPGHWRFYRWQDWPQGHWFIWPKATKLVSDRDAAEIQGFWSHTSCLLYLGICCLWVLRAFPALSGWHSLPPPYADPFEEHSITANNYLNWSCPSCLLSSSPDNEPFQPTQGAWC